MAKTKKKLTCPKCQAEMQEISFGGIDFEYCPNCKSYCLDYDEIKKPAASDLDTDITSDKTEKSLDRKKIKCIKCGALMEKDIQEGNIMLDECTSCGSVWFDKGELYSFTHKEESLLKRPKKVTMQMKCGVCDILIDWNDTSAETKKKLKCPRCHGPLLFKKEFVTKIYKREILFIIMTICLFLFALIGLRHLKHAVILTGCMIPFMLGAFFIWHHSD